MMRLSLLAAGTALISLAACGDAGDTPSEPTGTTNQVAVENAQDGGTRAVPTEPRSAAEYATLIGASDMFEIESARIAIEKSGNAEVQALAEMILADHQKSTAMLRQAAAQAQPALGVRPEMTMEQQASLTALRAVEPGAFDRQYLNQQVRAHEQALAIATSYGATGDDPNLREHATTVAGPIQQHLERARTLAGSVGG